MSRLVLDAGAFIAFERGSRLIRARLEVARRQGLDVTTVAPVVAQVWRDGARQAGLARLLLAVRVDAPGARAAKRAGALLGETKTSDVVDALLVVHAGDGDVILTSDPEDIERLLDAAGTRAVVDRV